MQLLIISCFFVVVFFSSLPICLLDTRLCLHVGAEVMRNEIVIVAVPQRGDERLEQVIRPEHARLDGGQHFVQALVDAARPNAAEERV